MASDAAARTPSAEPPSEPASTPAALDSAREADAPLVASDADTESEPDERAETLAVLEPEPDLEAEADPTPDITAVEPRSPASAETPKTAPVPASPVRKEAESEPPVAPKLTSSPPAAAIADPSEAIDGPRPVRRPTSDAWALSLAAQPNVAVDQRGDVWLGGQARLAFGPRAYGLWLGLGGRQSLGEPRSAAGSAASHSALEAGAGFELRVRFGDSVVLRPEIGLGLAALRHSRTQADLPCATLDDCAFGTTATIQDGYAPWRVRPRLIGGLSLDIPWRTGWAWTVSARAAFDPTRPSDELRPAYTDVLSEVDADRFALAPSSWLWVEAAVGLRWEAL